MPDRCRIDKKYHQLELRIRIRHRQRMAAVKSLQLKLDSVPNVNHIHYSWIFHLKRLICLNIFNIWSTATCSTISSSPIAAQLQALYIDNLTVNNVHYNEDRYRLSLAKLKCLFLASFSASWCPILQVPSCQTLTLQHICLHDDWCQTMSRKKYLQNVKRLVLEVVSFECSDESIKKLASSLTNIEYLHLGIRSGGNMQMLLLWKYLKNTIDSNKIHVSIHHSRFDNSELNLLHFVQSNQLKMSHFYSLRFDLSNPTYWLQQSKTVDS